MLRSLSSRLSTALLVVAALPGLAFSQSKEVVFGRTSVKLSPDFVNALGSLNVAASAVNEGRLVYGVASFPVTGGVLDLATAKGEIAHAGGLQLAAGGTVVTLLNFTIDTTGSQPVLTGAVLVNGSLVGRLPLFNLTLPSGISLPLQPNDENALRLRGIKVTLTDAAAGALNQVFNVTAFQGGFHIGSARSQVFLAPIGSSCPNGNEDSSEQ